MISNIILKFGKASPLFKRVFRALFYSIFGTAGAKLVQLGCDILISRIIGQEFYGEFSMINSTVSLFVLFASIGVEATLTRYISLYRDNKSKIEKLSGTIFLAVSIFSLCICTCMFLLSDQVSILSCGSLVLGSYFKITSFTVFFTVVAAAFRSFLVGLENYRIVAYSELGSVAIYALIAVILTSRMGLIGSIVSLAFLHFIRLSVFGIYIRRHNKRNGIKPFAKFDEEIINVILKFTLPAFISSLFVVPVGWIINSIITKSFGFGELAVYNVSMQWKTMIIYIPTQMNQLRPIYTNLYAEGDYNKLHKLLFKSSIGSAGLVLPFVLGGILFGETILSFYGPEYAIGYPIFSIIILTMIPYSVQMQIGSYLQAIGKMWTGLLLNIIWATVYIGGSTLLVSNGGIGFAKAYFVSYTIHCALSLILVFSLKRSMYK